MCPSISFSPALQIINYIEEMSSQLMQESTKANSNKILITVGTTEFDALVEYCCSAPFLSLLKQCGLQNAKITYQIGTTCKFIPENVNYFRISNNIQQIYDEHDIIFTHGGAGTLLACLKSPCKNKKIIAVANTTLAGNHQTQLISKLHEQGYLLGFQSVDELKKSQSKVSLFLNQSKAVQPFESESKFLLNRLVFGEQS